LLKAASVGRRSLDLARDALASTAVRHEMPDSDKQIEGKQAQPSRLEEGRRIIEHYAANLRELVRKLRQKMN